MEPVNIVLADSDTERRIEDKKMLFQDSEMEVLGETENIEQTTNLVLEERPDLLLLSFPFDGQDVSDLIQELAVEVPHLEILLIAESMEDSEEARKFLRMGAKDILVRPIESDELLTEIEDIITVSRKKREKLTEIMTGESPGTDQRDGKVISVFSTKGGVGRSLVATNLACMIRELTEKRVALVDLDLQFGDNAIMLDMTPTTMIASLARDCKEENSVDYELLERYMHTHGPSGVDLLAAPPRPEEADYVEAADTKKILKALRKHYHYVVIDTSSQITDPVIAALENSDLILLLLTLELPTIKDGSLMLELVDNLGIEKEKVQIVMNRDIPGSEIQLEEVEEALEHEILGGLPSEGELIMPSVNEGRPIVLSHKRSKFSRRLDELTRSMIENVFEFEDEIVRDEESAGVSAGSIDNPASIGSRFLAGTVDFILSILVGWGLFIGVGIFLGVNMGTQAGVIMGFALGLAGMLVPIGYFGALQAGGQTLGDTLTNITVVDAEGNPITMGVSFLRALVMSLTYLFLGLGFLWILIDDENRGLHDIVAGSFVANASAE